MKKLFCLNLAVLLLFMCHSFCFADVSLPWSSTYDCPDWVQGDGEPDCDGIVHYGDWKLGEKGEQIAIEANNPGGGGGNGQRHWVGDGKNVNSGGMLVRFNTPQRELWVRWYMRYEKGFQWNPLVYDKWLYFKCSNGSSAVPEWKGNNNTNIWTNVGDDYYSKGNGWNTVMRGNVSDGMFHCYEVHLKMDTDGSDGILEMWIDSKKILSHYNANCGTELGWTYFAIGSNQDSPNNGRIMYVDYDDIAVSNTGYIGPIKDNQKTDESTGEEEGLELNMDNEETSERFSNAGETTDSILFQENFDNADFASRGWYDNTNIQLSSDEHVSGGTSAAEFHFTKGDTKPLSGSAIRKKFTETDEVYVSYFVKYSANWEGSNKRYHPHEFYLSTNVDGNWTGPASTHLTAYIEQNEGAPLLSIQDAQNIDEANIGVDLTHVTENRAVAGCNGDGDCYKAGDAYRNGKQWRADNVYFQDVPGQYYKNDWHFIEAYFKLNTISGGKGVTDGQVKYWYDGKLIIDHNNVIMRTAQHPDIKFNQFLIGPYIGDGSPVDQTFWVDNLTVASSRVSEAIPPEKQATLADNVPAKDSDEEHKLDMVDNDNVRQIESLPRIPEVIYLPQEIDLTKRTVGGFPVKIRVEGIEEREHSSIFPRIRYQMGTGSSYGFFDMAPEGGGVWRFDIPDPKWHNYRSNSLHYQVKLFDEEGTVISESRWEVELIDSFIQKD